MQQEVMQTQIMNDGSELYAAMEAERSVKAQSEAAKRVLAQRQQELQQLLSRCDMRFSSLTPVEEVIEAHVRAEALRWLIACIRREVDDLNAEYDSHLNKVQQLLS